MISVAETFFARALRRLARMVHRNPQWFVLPQLALFAVCVFYTAFYLEFDMNQDHLVGADKKSHQVYMKFREEFPGEDELAVVVESEDQERNRQFVERLAARLEPETNLFTEIFYKGDLTSLGPKALLYVPDEDLQKMREKLENYRPFIDQFTHASNLNSFFGLINKQFREAKQEENASNNALIGAVPVLQRIVEDASDSLSRPGTPVSPGVAALFGAGEEAQKRMYNTFANGRIYLVTARPRTEAVVEEAVKRMRQLIHQTEFEVPGLNVGLTGEPVLDYDQMLQSKKDATLASVVALLISFLIFTYAYGETRRPLKAVFCLVVGMGYSMGFATLAVGHLNILTITFAPILIGLAIDFGIHFITRYEEEIRNERTEEEALEKAMVFTGQGIVTGGLTTAGAFIAMWLTNFKGIQEMGIICGGGLALSLVPMMTMLPALLVRAGRKGAGHAVGLPAEERARIEGIWLRRPWWVVGGAGALCLLAATQFHKVSFDYNLTHLQSKGLPAVVYDLKLLFATASTFAADDITNLPVLVGKLTAKQDPVSTFVGDHLDLAARSQMASYQCGKQNEDELQAALAKDFNRIIAGPLIFSPDRFRAVSLKPATAQLLRSRPQGEDLMRLNKMLLQDAFPGEVLEHPGQSLLYAAVVADNLKEAAQFERALTNLPAVGSVDGNDRGQPIFELLTKDQSQEMKAARLVKEEVSSLKFAPVDTNEVALHELGMTLYSTTGYLNLAAEEAGKEMPELGAELRSLAESISELRVKMLAEDNPAAPHLLRDYQRALFEDIRQTFESIRNQETGSRLMPQDLPASWRGRFVGRSGKFAVVVFPREDIWQHDVQEKFIHQVRGALGKMGDRLTGMPVQVYEYTTLLKQSYQQAALYSLVAIAFLVYLHFRSVVCVVLSLLPVALGSAWTLGLMGLAGVPFNPANIMTLPLVIGIGVTNGIHILNRVAEEHNANILGKSTGKAVLVSGLTALTGFGSLMLGKHQGLQSLGLVMSAGIAACMIAGLTFLPALISILGEHGWAMTQKKLGDSILALPPSVEEPR